MIKTKQLSVGSIDNGKITFVICIYGYFVKSMIELHKCKKEKEKFSSKY